MKRHAKGIAYMDANADALNAVGKDAVLAGNASLSAQGALASSILFVGEAGQVYLATQDFTDMQRDV